MTLKSTLEEVLAGIDLLNELRASLKNNLAHESAMPTQGKTSTPVKTFDQGSRRKSKPTTLIIEIDGQTIKKRKAKVAFVDAFKVIGVARVEGLDLRLGGRLLIVRDVRPKEGAYLQSGEYWVATHSDTAEKARVLQEACRRLNVPCSITQVPRSQISILDDL
jgi:hypothetical protein